MKSKLLAIATAVAFYFAYWAAPATAATIVFSVNLDGPSESPPNSIAGNRYGDIVTFNDVLLLR